MYSHLKTQTLPQYRVINTITSSFHTYFPLKLNWSKKIYCQTYVTTDIKAMIREKKRLQRKYAQHPVIYTTAQQGHLHIRKAIVEYYLGKFKEISCDSKKT